MTELAPELAEWVVALRPESIPPMVAQGVRDRLVDTLGVAVAGIGFDAGVAVRKVVERWAGAED